MSGIIIAALIVGVVGFLVAIFLSVAGKAFFVPIDEKEVAITDALPGANCGGCGYSGCAACAAAIAKGEAAVNACVVGQQPVADEVAKIMGVTAEAGERKVAFVHCVGDCEKTHMDYEYYGPKKCSNVKMAPGNGPKSCSYGCIGLGECVEACEYDAIHIVNGVAKVDEEKCKDCKACMKVCPNGLITEVPYNYVSHIGCSNPEKGKPVMQNCKVGCITCQKCMRDCPVQAITMDKGYPVIDYVKCTNCGICKVGCPRNCIV